MIKASDSIEGSGHPLAFRLQHATQTAALAGLQPGAESIRVEARAMGGHQKEAVITEVGSGAAWRLVSDEGPVLGGSDLAPAPLSFFCAGLQSDLMGRIRAVAAHHDVRINALSTTVANHFAFTGSFVSGTGLGTTQPAEIAIALDAPTSWENASRWVSAAMDASPAVACLRAALANTFALYVNGRRVNVHGVHASAAADAADPYLSHARPPRPLPDGQPSAPLMLRLKDSDAKPAPLPASGGSASIVVQGQGQAQADAHTMSVETRLLRPPGSSFMLQTDESGTNPQAPSGLALLSAGVSFCYLTQLLRYVQHRKYDVRAIRLVQYSPYAIEGALSSQTLRAQAGSVDTHLFLHGTADAAVMQELLLYSARTCFLHAALGSAFEPRATLSLNGGPSRPISIERPITGSQQETQ